MPCFRWEGRGPVTTDAFLEVVGGYLEQAREIDLPVLTAEDLHGATLIALCCVVIESSDVGIWKYVICLCCLLACVAY